MYFRHMFAPYGRGPRDSGGVKVYISTGPESGMTSLIEPDGNPKFLDTQKKTDRVIVAKPLE